MQLISVLTENVIAYAASVLLWFQARDSLTERAEQGGCLKVMFSQIPRFHAHTLTHVLTYPEGGRRFASVVQIHYSPSQFLIPFIHVEKCVH